MTHKELKYLKPKDIISKYIGAVLVEFKLLNKTDNGWEAKRVGADSIWNFSEQELLKCEVEEDRMWDGDYLYDLGVD